MQYAYSIFRKIVWKIFIIVGKFIPYFMEIERMTGARSLSD